VCERQETALGPARGRTSRERAKGGKVSDVPVPTLLSRLVASMNSALLAVGRTIGWIAIAVMVLIILYQVTMRYAFNAAPNWTEEAARFLMLWSAGLMAPSAYRLGGFVAIDTAMRMLPARAAGVLSLLLLGLSGTVLAVGAAIGWNEVTGFAGTFETASLNTFVFPSLEHGIAFGWDRMPRSQMMASLLVGFWLLLLVNVELILKALVALFDPARKAPADPGTLSARTD